MVCRVRAMSGCLLMLSSAPAAVQALERPVLTLSPLQAAMHGVKPGGAPGDMVGATEVAAPFPFAVALEGVADDPKIQEALKKHSFLMDSENAATIASLSQLRYRTVLDVGTFRRMMHSLGYYEAHVSYHIDAVGSDAKVTLEVTPGPRYHLSDVRIDSSGLNAIIEDVDLRLEEEFFYPGMPAEAATIVRLEEALIKALQDNGFPFAKADKREVVVNYQTKGMRVLFEIDSGPRAFFGPPEIHTLETVKEQVVVDALAFQEGEIYDARKLEKTRENLANTELFSSIYIVPEQKITAADRVPINLHVEEAAHRSLGGGVNYTSDYGPGVQGFWRHRNVLGLGNLFEVSARANHKTRDVTLSYEAPNFLRPHQIWDNELKVYSGQEKAYYHKGVKVETSLGRNLWRHVDASFGLALIHSTVTQENVRGVYNLVGVPLEASWTTATPLLTPERGFKLTGKATPYMSFRGNKAHFWKIEVDYAHFFPVTEKTVLEGWGRVGFMPFARRVAVPPDQLFYLGGAGSLRGYDTQLAGPLRPDHTPLGGLSFLSGGGEVIHALTEHLSGLVFLEGGNVMPTTHPRTAGRFFWGTGFGVQYKTFVGPVRAEIGFPLDRRRGIDRAWQLYISLGQVI